MKYCVACGNQIENDAKFCGKCGAEQKITKNKKPYVCIFIVLFLVLILVAATVINGIFFRETEEIDEKEAIVVSEEHIETEEELNAEEELEETEEVILDDIIEEMKEASEITKMVWGAYSKYLDEQDVIQANYFGVQNWKYKCVIYPDINSIKDFEELLGTFYTDNQVADYISSLQYVEQDGKLYIAEADGLGGLGVNEYAINISHDADELYKIEITAKYVGVGIDEIPVELNYRLTDKGWRFDQGIIFFDDAPLNLYGEEDQSVEKEKVTWDVLKRTSFSIGRGTNGVITVDGSLYMWGENDGYGQIGNGNGFNQLTPIKVLSDVVTISVGEYRDPVDYTSTHCGAITADGSLYMWGENFSGQVGNGDTKICSVPTKVLSDVIAVSLGYEYSGAITVDGSLYMWGRNINGQIGNGTTENQLLPTKVLSNVVAISLGVCHSGAVTEDGSLYMWGENSDGQLGNGTTEDQLLPVKVLSDVVAVSLDDYSSAAITSEGSLYMWGGGWTNGTGTRQLTPVKILSDVENVKMMRTIAGAITTDGSLYMWGENMYGEIGNGTTKDQATPVKVLSNVVDFDILESYFSGAVTEDGSLYMWGHNKDGQLGDGTTEEQLAPKKVLSNAVAISLGSGHVGAIMKDGSLYMWGLNSSGQVGNGTTENQTIPTEIMENVRLPISNNN